MRMHDPYSFFSQFRETVHNDTKDYVQSNGTNNHKKREAKNEPSSKQSSIKLSSPIILKWNNLHVKQKNVQLNNRAKNPKFLP